MHKKQTVKQAARKVRLLMLDVDGVLTDGRIVYDSSGREMKFFDVHDGLGVYLLKKVGIPTVIITAKASACIGPRARDMRIAHVYTDVHPKSRVLGEIMSTYKVSLDQICFIGDDLVDISLMTRVGLPIAVANAHAHIKRLAAHITSNRGGRGAVREIADLILNAQHKWDEALKDYDV